MKQRKKEQQLWIGFWRYSFFWATDVDYFISTSILLPPTPSDIGCTSGTSTSVMLRTIPWRIFLPHVGQQHLTEQYKMARREVFMTAPMRKLAPLFSSARKGETQKIRILYSTIVLTIKKVTHISKWLYLDGNHLAITVEFQINSLKKLKRRATTLDCITQLQFLFSSQWRLFHF